MKSTRNNLIKFGVSEHKRTDLLASYIAAIIVFQRNANNCITKEDLQKQLEEEGFFFAKKEKNISRELPRFKNKLFFLEKKNNSKGNQVHILLTEKASKWGREEDDKVFYGLSSMEYAFFEMLLKQGNEKGKNTFLYLVKNLCFEAKTIKEVLIDEEYKTSISEAIKNNKDIKQFIKYRSDTPNKDDLNKVLVSQLRNEIVDLFLKSYDEKKDKTTCFHNTKKILLNLEKINKANNGKFPDGLIELLFENKKRLKKDWKKNIKGQQINLYEIVNNKEQLLSHIMARIIGGSYSSYKSLIVNHFMQLPMFFSVYKDTISLQESAKPIIKNIIEREDKVLELKCEKHYSPKKLKEIFELNGSMGLIQLDIKSIIQNNYQLKMLRSILDLDFENRIKIQSFIAKHNHIKNRCNVPTFFEYIIGMTFLIGENPDLLKKSNEEIIKLINKTFNTILSSDLAPLHHAPGGRADIEVKLKSNKNLLLIEPTLQLKRQIKMELDSTVSHLMAKNQANKSLIVSLKIEELLISALKGINEDHLKPNGKLLATTDINKIKDYLDKKIEVNHFFSK